MKFLIVAVALCCLGAVTFASAIDAEDVDKKKTTTTVLTSSSTEPVTSSSTEPSTVTSTIPSTEPSTTPSTVTPTPAPTTPTPEPPTTPSTQVPTTTVAPPSTTVAPITTTAKPPKPQQGNWTYFDTQTNKTCVMVLAAISLDVAYIGNDTKRYNATLTVPSDAKVSGGECLNTTQLIHVSGLENRLNFTFNFTKVGNDFELDSMVFVIAKSYLVNATDDLTVTFNNKTFVTPLDHSYYCTREQVLVAYETTNNTMTSLPAKITVSHVQMEAFHSKASALFSTAKDCDAIAPTDIVPIAVGIALAALVVIVLIAYLVARRRSQQGGYVSM